MQEATHNRLAMYLSPEHPCAYLEGQSARTVFLDPQVVPSQTLYDTLATQGFRRSSGLLYRPQCQACHACVPLRIPVAEFKPDRGQRRVWRANRDIKVRQRPAEFDTEHFELYQRYQSARHPDGGMDQHTPGDYNAFLTSRWSRTLSVEFRLAEKLVAVAVMDELGDALSAVYTFYDPELARRSLGTYAILWQIAEARCRDLCWLYLGYWIAASRKMAYKNRFRPFEQLSANGWQHTP